MQFTDLGLPAPILEAVAGEGYTVPTPIQAQTIPAVLTGRDVLGIAQTGTGKTAAFALPILARLVADPKQPMRRSTRVLVLSPTRELASQIAQSFRTYGKNLGLTVAVVFGGVAMRPQIQAMSRGVDVLVATPGRLIDHMGERTIELAGTEIFVLDEADQMLDLGFVRPIRKIVSQLTMRRQNLFFSATMPREIAGLADEMLKDPVKVAVAPIASTVDRVSQRVIQIEASKKKALLVELFKDPDLARTLVFTRTKRGADRVAKHLEVNGIEAAAIHGNKSQNQRERALEAFKRAEVRVLVATDIAARGIDIDAVSHVVNYELPEVPEAYVHRIGRTARAGAAGSAISLCDREEIDLLRGIERLIRQQIPSQDRRGDAALAAEVKKGGSGAGRDREDRRYSPRGSGGGDRGQRSGGEQRSAAPRGAPRGENRGPRGPRPEGRPFERDRRDGERSFAPRPDGAQVRRPDDRRNDEARGPRPAGQNGERPSRFSAPRPADREHAPRGEHRGPPRGDRRPQNGEGRSERPRSDERRGEQRFEPRRDGAPRPAEQRGRERDQRPQGGDRPQSGDRPQRTGEQRPHNGARQGPRTERPSQGRSDNRPERRDRPQAAPRSDRPQRAPGANRWH